MTAPATPQNLHLVNAAATDAHHAVLTIACDAVPGARYRWSHAFGNPYSPTLRTIEETANPQLVVGPVLPFIVAPGEPYTVSVEAVVGAEVSVPNTVQFDAPAFVAAPHLAGKVPFATLPIVDFADSFQFTHAITGPKGTQDVDFTYDTGAYTPLFSKAAASALGLPNLGPVTVSGVGGSNTAYNSEFGIQIGSRSFVKQPCIVDDSFQQNLYGASFLMNNKLAIFIDPVKQTISFYDAG